MNDKNIFIVGVLGAGRNVEGTGNDSLAVDYDHLVMHTVGVTIQVDG